MLRDFSENRINTRLCVFCGSSEGTNLYHMRIAKEMGKILALRKIGIVFGGANTGLMRAVADGAFQAGGEVIGVIPESLAQRGIVHNEVSRTEIVESMLSAKQRMLQLSDGYIALPGGIGTLDELFEVLVGLQLGLLSGPCGMLNIDGFFSPLLYFLDELVHAEFLREEHRSLLLVEQDPEALVQRIIDSLS